MRAAVHDEYGPPDVLHVEHVDMPDVADDELLVRVAAASVNPGDWDVLHGSPYILRASTGFRRPRNRILGLAISGRVEAVGVAASGFQPGDEVYAGIGSGGFAEYAHVPGESCARKPSNVTFEEAAALPVSGTTALQGLRDVAHIQSGQKVLINGTSGGVGTFAVQTVDALGAEVTGVCSTTNVSLVYSIGARHVVDYTEQGFKKTGQQYDLIFDNVGNRSQSDLRRALVRGGMLLPNSNKGKGRWIGGYVQRAMKALVTSPFVDQKLKPFASTETADDLVALAGMIESGQVTPVVDRTYTLGEIAEALDYYDQGHVKGKVVITMNGNSNQERGG